MDINNWFDFPVHVFMDTQVYINESFNFNEKGNLSFFRKQVLNGNIVHLTSEVILGEVEKHIRKDIIDALGSVNKAVGDRKLAIFRDKRYPQLQHINEPEMLEEAIAIFRAFISDTKAFMLHIETVNLKSVISDYFEAKAPFGVKKDKKSEFPDAFNLSMLRQYAAHNHPVVILSGDGDFSEEEDIVCFKTLGDLLNAIHSQDEITNNVKKYLGSKRQYLFDEVESYLMDNGYAFEVDGTDTDRKGTQHGVEYDEVELFSFSAVSLTHMDIMDIDLPDGTITVSLDCKAVLDFSCTFIDEAFGDNFTHGTMEETHNATIPITLNISFEHDDGSTTFEIDDIDIIISDIELNQYTLREGSRVRTDNPNRYWDDNDPVNNPCPDCGCEMMFETEGGNGFCVNCASNH